MFGSGVNPELMCSSGYRFKLDSCFAIFYQEFFPVGNSHLSVNRIINLMRSIVNIEAERKFDDTLLAI